MMYSLHVMPMFGFIFMLLFWVGLFLLINKYQPWQEAKESNLDIAKRRYSQGEISESQLNEIKNNL